VLRSEAPIGEKTWVETHSWNQDVAQEMIGSEGFVRTKMDLPPILEESDKSANQSARIHYAQGASALQQGRCGSLETGCLNGINAILFIA
jgi:hypothetical protein